MIFSDQWDDGFYVTLDGKPLRGPFYHRTTAIESLQQMLMNPVYYQLEDIKNRLQFVSLRKGVPNAEKL